MCRYLSLFGWPDGLRDIRHPTDLVQCVGIGTASVQIILRPSNVHVHVQCTTLNLPIHIRDIHVYILTQNGLIPTPTLKRHFSKNREL